MNNIWQFLVCFAHSSLLIARPKGTVGHKGPFVTPGPWAGPWDTRTLISPSGLTVGPWDGTVGTVGWDRGTVGHGATSHRGSL